MYKKELYPKELFELIFAYAKKKAEIIEIDYIESIRLYTPIYFLIGNYSWDFIPNSLLWKEFLKGVEQGENLVELAYNLHVINYQDPTNKQKWFGCFRYKYVKDEQGSGVIKLHFLNDGSSKEGPLALCQSNQRIKELKEMFEDVKKNYPEAEYVEGGSWLYNLESYRRLFPKEYFKNMKSRLPKTNILVIWGQFINSEWGIKEKEAQKFKIQLEKTNTLEELDNVFEMFELQPKGEIKYFYKFYSIK